MAFLAIGPVLPSYPKAMAATRASVEKPYKRSRRIAQSWMSLLKKQQHFFRSPVFPLMGCPSCCSVSLLVLSLLKIQMISLPDLYVAPNEHCVLLLIGYFGKTTATIGLPI